MPRTALTPITLPTANSVTPATVAWTVADAVNFNNFPATGREVIHAKNSGASAYTLTVHSSPDASGRTGDITAFSLAAAEEVVTQVMPLSGWQQSDGTVWIDANNAAVLLWIERLS